MDNIKTDCVPTALEGMCAEYASRGDKVTKIKADTAFESILSEFGLKQIWLITCDANQHTSRIYWLIQ